VIDIPVGPTAKVRTTEAAGRLAERLVQVGTAVGLHVRCVTTDGSQPVGRGVGPALEARDVLAVLDGDRSAPPDLRERALQLAGDVIELAQAAPSGGGVALATAALASGDAKRKFDSIRIAQGGVRQPGRAPLQREIAASADGTIAVIDNRRISRSAKLAGAPRASTAGLEMHVRLGDAVRRGQALFTLHAETQGEMEYAARYVESQPPAVTIAQSDS
jgi:thymidine phosphorylase